MSSTKVNSDKSQRPLMEVNGWILDAPSTIDIDDILTRGAKDLAAYASDGFRFTIRQVTSVIIDGHRYSDISAIPVKFLKDDCGDIFDSAHCSTINYTDNRYSDESGVIKII